MSNYIKKTFTANGTWVCPAGVTSVRASAVYTPSAVTKISGPGFIDSTKTLYMVGGGNSNGSFGIGDVTPRSSPVAVLGGFSWASVLNDQDVPGATLGLTTSGVLYAWGLNNVGQLGVGDQVARSSPVAVAGGRLYQSFLPVAQNAFALTTAGALYAWGTNTSGSLGLGDTLARSSPVAVVGGYTFKSFAANPTTYNQSTGLTVLALNTSGAAYAWGANTYGQIGDGSVVPKSSPVAVVGGLTFSSIAVGSNAGASCYGITTAGALYAWGENALGQLGVGDVIPRSSPVAVLGGLTWAKIIPASGPNGSVFGITTAGALYAWGANSLGQLGVGDVISRSSPVAVLGGLVFQDVMHQAHNSTQYSTLGLTTSGALYAWGGQKSGELGLGTAGTAYSSPVAVLGGLTFSKFALTNTTSGPVSGACYAYGLTTSGVLYAWGDNLQGQLGLGDVVVRSSPIAVLGGLIGNMISESKFTNITVVPGTSYTITIGAQVTTFGTTQLGGIQNNTVQLEYFQ